MGYYYPNGLSSKATAPAVLTSAIYTSAKPVYVDSVNGSDSYDGSYTRPYATLGAADATGRIIVLKSGHTETYTSAATLLNGCTVVGEQSSAGTPLASLLNNQANGTLFTLSSNKDLEFKNVRFPPEVQSNASSRLSWSTAGQRFIDCTFEDDSLDANGLMDINGDHAHLSRCSFVASGTSTSTAPSTAAVTMNASANIGVRIADCTFDNGAYGRSAGIGAADLSDLPSRAENTSCLRGARVALGTTALGYASVGTATEGGGFDTDSHYHHPTGVSSGSGDPMLTANLLTSQRVRFVDSDLGADTNSGYLGAPYATLAAALAAVTTATDAHSIIVVRDGHTETLASGTDLDQVGTVILGEGTVTLTVANTTTDGLILSAAGCELRNLAFVSDTATTGSVGHVTVSGDGCAVVGCRFTASAGGSYQLYVTGDYSRVEDCDFTLTSVSMARGLVYLGNSNLYCNNCSVDGGTVGYTTTGAVFTGTPVRVENLTVTNNAHVTVNSSQTGYLQVTADATCEVKAF